jgi:hypothetical protein
MSKTIVVNVRSDEYDVYIGRVWKGSSGSGASMFGNPFIPDDRSSEESRQACLDKYRIYFEGRLAVDPVFRAAVLALRGKRLGCFCAPKSCHGDIIAEYLETFPEGYLPPAEGGA